MSLHSTEVIGTPWFGHMTNHGHSLRSILQRDALASWSGSRQFSSESDIPRATSRDPGSPQNPIDLRNVRIPEEGGDEGVGGGIETKIPSEGGWLAVMYRIGMWCSGPSVLVVIFLFSAFGLIYGASRELGYHLSLRHIFERVDWEREVSVAFIGNAYLFVNDMPRIMQAISKNQIHQNSVIHPGGSLGSLLLTGNGMYSAWKTGTADLGQQYIKDYGRKEGVYDFGMCSVKQLLLGVDEYMGYGNPYGAYKNDGLNPCIMDQYYYSYVAGNLADEPVKWDYVVLAGQTKRMVVESARNDTLFELVNSYAPMLNQSGAIPLLVDTHAFWSDSTNMTGLGNDVPSFTANIQNGVKVYASALAEALPRSQAPIIAPVGLAYLTVWEENYDLWRMLFVRDMVHASVYGSFLFACVLYMTIFGHRLPDNDFQFPSEVADLFATSRKLVGGNHYFPSQEEMAYLKNVAKRVVLKGYVPPSLPRHSSGR
ncbi:hypothetical protein FisN_12Hh190 [Fistulifera solaris]|uniref:Uncharacterized protein n=1 Tax=Fistulifera solaris TaxID=1519565 RepID=A0A1Z5KCH2_FISSO|nr:hypothetical protein FisN_12Hh190 [Fistulifera solaris]|eukprot:GAX23618.1 hypothetical protein FisN_12Hh190 [Fistulifera solaris]